MKSLIAIRGVRFVTARLGGARTRSAAGAQPRSNRAGGKSGAFGPSTVAASDPFEEIPRHALDVGGRHALHARQRFVEAEVAVEVDFLPRQVRHPAGGVLEAQHQAALEVILRALELVVGHRRALQAAQLLDAEVNHFLDRIGRAAGIDRDVAGVAIRAHAAEDRIGQPALLAHVLKQPRAHRAAEHGVQDVADVAIVVVLLVAVRAEADMALFELLGPRQHGRLDASAAAATMASPSVDSGAEGARRRAP